MIAVNSFARTSIAGIVSLACLALFALPQTALALGSTPVTVANPTSSPVPTADVNNPAFQPIQFSLLPHSSTSNQNAIYFQVPAGKRLVIEYFSAQAQDLSGGAAAMTLGTTAGGSFVSYIIYVNKQDTNAVQNTVRIYADPGSSVQAFAFNASPATSCGGLISVSGYLVDIP